MSATQAENYTRQVPGHRTPEEKLDKLSRAVVELALSLKAIEEKLALR
jgi:hypothetical protein